ncbi:MAG TPA: hypothetical protein VLA02_16575, partial [Reyranella sp.]|nr:hypothetical protein [Reyranella sp.]
RSAKVGLVDTIPDLRRKRVEVREGDADIPRRVVHEDVDPAEMADHRLEAELDRFGISLIQLNGAGLTANPSHRLHYRTGTTSLADIGNGDIRAGGSKSLCDCAANVAGASGHKRNFSSQIHRRPLKFRQASTINNESISVSSWTATRFLQQLVERHVARRKNGHLPDLVHCSIIP